MGVWRSQSQTQTRLRNWGIRIGKQLLSSSLYLPQRGSWWAFDIRGRCETLDGVLELVESAPTPRTPGKASVAIGIDRPDIPNPFIPKDESTDRPLIIDDMPAVSSFFQYDRKLVGIRIGWYAIRV